VRAHAEQVVDRFVPFLLLLTLVVFAIHKIVAHDVWWQLATGEWVLAHGVPSTDPFSYYTPDRPWIEMRWLYCVAIDLVRSAFGLNGLIVAKTIALVAAFGLLWWATPRRRWWAASFGVACALAIAHTRFQVRPELVSYVLLPAVLACLARYKAGGDRRWLYALPALQIVWTNAHTLFALGPVTVWIFVASEWAAAWIPFGPFRREPTRLSGERLKLAAIVAVLVTAACLVNPYFLRGALFPLQLFSQIREGNALDTLIDELRSPFELAGMTYYFLSYLVVVAASAATFWLDRRRVPLSRLAIWGAYLYLSALAQRNLALFGIVAGFAIAANLTEADEAGDLGGRLARAIPWTARAASILFALVMIPLVASDAYYRRTDTAKLFGFGVAEHRFPIRAMAFVRREGLPTPVLNSLGDGGYVLFEGGPKSVYVDGRLEVYGEAVISDAVRLLTTGEGVDALADRFGISTAVVRHKQEAALLQTLARSPAWAPVYFDESHVVFVRLTPATRETAERLRVDWRNPVVRDVEVPPELAPADPLAGLWPKAEVPRDEVALGQLYTSVGNLDAARRELEAAIARDPDDETANLYLGIIERATNREAEAKERLSRVDAELLERADVQRLAGSVYEQAGNPAAAVGAYQRAIELGDRSADAYTMLGRAALAAKRPEVARAAFLEAARRAPSAPVWNNLAVLSLASGDTASALRYFGASLEANPSQPGVLNQVGVLKLQTGDANGAREAFSHALAVDPSYQPARENLAKMGVR
jgi:Tfp pilus assembly protein PilF